MILAIGVLAVSLVAVCAYGYRLKERAEESEREVELLSKKLSLKRPTGQAERERDFFLRFAREFPSLTQDLHSQVDTRRIPGELTKILVRSFHPWQAVVVLRRFKVASDPSRSQGLVIAAVARPDTGLQAGMELEVGVGEIGLVAHEQRVMGRDDIEKLPPHVRSQLKANAPAGIDFDLVAPMVVDGETLGVLAIARPNLFSESSKAVFSLVAHMGAMAIHHAAAYGKMKVSAEVDGLTGLYNKTYVFKALSEKIVECRAAGRQLSILLLDIDNFKNYNDVNGHDEGDQLLREFAQVIGDNIRGTSIFGRYGGEEFLLILPGIGAEAALKAAENVRRKVAAHPFRHRERQPLGVVSFSGGVATFPEDESGSAELIRAADKALYEAKRAGRNQVLRARPKQLGSGDEPTDATMEMDRVFAEPRPR